MRTITLIIVHCSANRAGSALRLADIDRYHRSLGWKGCGYHYVIPTDGTIETGRTEAEVGAHCKKHNRHSIGICYIGGMSADGKPADTRTDAQRTSLRKLLEALHRKYPRALIVGHRDLDPLRRKNASLQFGNNRAAHIKWNPSNSRNFIFPSAAKINHLTIRPTS